jgi:hypothetical protein
VLRDAILGSVADSRTLDGVLTEPLQTGIKEQRTLVTAQSVTEFLNDWFSSIVNDPVISS